MNTIYFICAPQLGKLKLGWSDNFPQRLRQLRAGCPCELTVLTTIVGTEDQEKAMQQELDWCRDHHEWYFDSPLLRQWIDEKVAAFRNTQGEEKHE